VNKRNLEHLSTLAYRVTQQAATEPPFSGKYNDFDQAGRYHCIVCDAHLFDSKTKFNSGCGWPAFFEAIENTTEEREDLSHGMVRTEVLCRTCGAHLGHKFADGPYGIRYCINSVALQFYPQES